MPWHHGSGFSGPCFSSSGANAHTEAFMFTHSLKPALLGQIDLRTWCKAVEFARTLDWNITVASSEPLILDVSGSAEFATLAYGDPETTFQGAARNTVIRAALAVIERMSTSRFRIWTAGEPTGRMMETLKQRVLSEVKRQAEARLSGGVLDLIEGNAAPLLNGELADQLRSRWFEGVDGYPEPRAGDLNAGLNWVFSRPFHIVLNQTGGLTIINDGWDHRFRDAVEGLTEESARGVGRTVGARAVDDVIAGGAGLAFLDRLGSRLNLPPQCAIFCLRDELKGEMRKAARDRGLEGLLRFVSSAGTALD